MVNQRTFIPPSAYQVNPIFLRGRLYSVQSASPRNLSVYTHCTSLNPQAARYPCVENYLDHPRVQPYVHDVNVQIRTRRSTTVFRIFFKRHVHLPCNPTLRVHGNIVVMRVASKCKESVVNMRGRDARLADTMIKRYVLPKLP
jgi:hypothetical protein